MNMSRLNIKLILPYNYYTIRRVKIKLSNGNEFNIMHREHLEIEIENAEWIEFKLDYHKYKLQLENIKPEEYIIVTLDFRDYFPFYFLDIMFKNSMLAKLVTKGEFENYETKHSLIEPKEKLKKKDYAALAMNLLVFLTFILLSIFYSKIDSSDKNFVFVIGVAGLISNSRFIFRKRVDLRTFKLSMSLGFYIIMLLLIFFNFDNIINFSVLIITTISYLITAHNKRYILRPDC
jgi:hypothetical protein